MLLDKCTVDRLFKKCMHDQIKKEYPIVLEFSGKLTHSQSLFQNLDF